LIHEKFGKVPVFIAISSEIRKELS